MSDVAPLLAGLAGLAGTMEQPRLMAIGWATVDLERTLGGLDGTNARVTDDDLLLGARAWRVDAGPVVLILLEPNTEGRLAAALARNGEGIAALYLRSEGPTAGVVRGALRRTALGLPGRVSSQRHPWGPFLIEISPSAPGGPSS